MALRRERASDQSLLMLQQQLEALRGQVQETVGHLSGTVQAGTTQQAALQQGIQGTLQGLGDTSRQVVARLAEVQAASRRVEELGRSLSELQEILKPTKVRGELGEALLLNVLEQVLPVEHLVAQHAFRSGAKVDFVLKTPHGMVPIDVKFPLESFQRLAKAANEEEKGKARQEFRRSLKAKVDEIADKYVCPDEGTLDFAFMYIPAEGVYAELAAWDSARYGDDLLAYARSKRVIAVSPNTFHAYLQTVLMGLKGMKIEAQARTIREGLARMQGDFQKVLAKSSTLSGHLKNALEKGQDLDRDLQGLDSRLKVLTGENRAP